MRSTLNMALKIGIPLLVLLLFAVLLNKVSYAPSTQEMEDFFNALFKAQESHDWALIYRLIDSLEKTWDRELKILQLGARIDDIVAFQSSLWRLKGFAKAQDKNGLLSVLEEMRGQWVMRFIKR